jgi:hypothetical protein
MDITCVVEQGARAAQTVRCHGDDAGLSALAQVLIALGSVCLGAALTGGLRAIADRRRRRTRMRALAEEIRQIRREAQERSVPPASGGVTQRGPLPTTSWTQVLASGDLAHLSTTEAAKLNELFATVETANLRAGQVPLFLQTANLSSDQDVQTLFLEEARRASSDPFAEVLTKLASALETVEARAGKRGGA